MLFLRVACESARLCRGSCTEEITFTGTEWEFLSAHWLDFSPSFSHTYSTYNRPGPTAKASIFLTLVFIWRQYSCLCLSLLIRLFILFALITAWQVALIHHGPFSLALHTEAIVSRNVSFPYPNPTYESTSIIQRQRRPVIHARHAESDPVFCSTTREIKQRRESYR